MRPRHVVLAIAASCAGAALEAQELTEAGPGWQVQGGGGMRYAIPVATMSGYLGQGQGLAASLWAIRSGSPLRLSGDAEYLRFGDHTVLRPYNGTGPAVAITSAADILLLGLGPGVAVRVGRLEGGLHAGTGAAYARSAARTAIGTSPQNQRGNTYTTLTWQVQGGASAAVRLAAGPRAARLALAGRIVHLGTTKFLRETNLPIGVISGLYANPTPYAPTFAVVALTLSAPL